MCLPSDEHEEPYACQRLCDYTIAQQLVRICLRLYVSSDLRLPHDPVAELASECLSSSVTQESHDLRFFCGDMGQLVPRLLLYMKRSTCSYHLIGTKLLHTVQLLSGLRVWLVL